MGRLISNHKTAEALRKTLKQLEADTSVDPHDPAFLSLKCALLQRIMEFERDTAETRASIHLVESQDPELAEAAPKADDTAIA